MKEPLVSVVVILVFIIVAAGCGNQKSQSVITAKQIPSIPHKVNNSTVCADCHKDGKNKAKVTEHLDRLNCTHCHKPEK